MGMLCDSTQDAETKECVALVSNNTFASVGAKAKTLPSAPAFVYPAA
jgi:hypothetical protein